VPRTKATYGSMSFRCGAEFAGQPSAGHCQSRGDAGQIVLRILHLPLGTTAPGTGPQPSCGGAGIWPRPQPGPGAKAANRRLHTRWAGFDARKKRPVVANVAIARELAGWCWSVAVLPD
jgi:hypothetical protein